MKPTPPYRISTPRTIIRAWNPSDAPAMAACVAANLEHLRPWMPWALGDPPPLDERVQLLRTFRGNFDLGRDFVYGIFAKDDRTVIGGTGLHDADTEEAFQIGYWLSAELCGLGIISEVVAALVQASFALKGIDRLEIRCHPQNLGSRRVAEKAGFELEGLRRRHFFGFPDGPRDNLVFTLFRDQLSRAKLPPPGSVECQDAAGRPILDGTREA